MAAKRRTPTPSSPVSAEEVLDQLLPLAVPGGVEVHVRAAILEAASPTQLLELASDSAIRPFLLCRLAPAAALVDPGRAGELAEVLCRRGHTPKLLRG